MRIKLILIFSNKTGRTLFLVHIDYCGSQFNELFTTRRIPVGLTHLEWVVWMIVIKDTQALKSDIPFCWAYNSKYNITDFGKLCWEQKNVHESFLLHLCSKLPLSCHIVRIMIQFSCFWCMIQVCSLNSSLFIQNGVNDIERENIGLDSSSHQKRDWMG